MCLNFKGKMLRAALGHSGKRRLEAALSSGDARNAHADLDCSPPPGSGRTCAVVTEKAWPLSILFLHCRACTTH